MKANKKRILEDERTKTQEYKSFYFAVISTMIITSIISLIVVIQTKTIVSIIWPLGIFFIFCIFLFGYQLYTADKSVPQNMISMLLKTDLSQITFGKRLIYYFSESLLSGILIVILSLLSSYFNIYPWTIDQTKIEIVSFIIYIFIIGVIFSIFEIAINEWKLSKYTKKVESLESTDEYLEEVENENK